MTLIILAVATALATYCGGLFALRFKDKLHLILGFSAGAVIGVAFFDLLPEAVEIGTTYGNDNIIAIVALGFMIYLAVDRFIGVHTHAHDHHEDEAHTHTPARKGKFQAGSFSFHSFLDGLGIGLAFQVSPNLGAIVAIAVLAHDFSDGINTVSAIIKNGGTRIQAMKWLLADALAPVLGIIATLFFTIPGEQFGFILALFAGFFLYIGASDLVPESFHAHPTKWTTFMTILGALFIYTVIKLAV